MWRWQLHVVVLLGVMGASAHSGDDSDVAVRWWLTTYDLQHALAEQPSLELKLSDTPASPGQDSIVIDGKNTYQSILGMGSSLDHSTCFNLSQLSPDERREVMEKLFHPEKGIGINLSRICMGTPDFTNVPWYSYDDLKIGEEDFELSRFSIEKDRAYVLPIVKQALAINPDLLYFASPWSPPGWMTSTGDMIGGYLLERYYEPYARYFVRFIESYREEGVPIHAVTVQNEPGVDRSKDSPKWRYPSCRFTPDQEAAFIKVLGKAFKEAGVDAEIWTYDHNFNVSSTADGDDPGIAYPRFVLSDPGAASFVAGVAFHGYAGTPSGMSDFHREFPHVPIHFTEGSVFGPLGGRTLAEYLKNWASSYNGWVTMLDDRGEPNRGPFRASRTCVTFDAQTKHVSYNYDYYQYGHFFRFITRGSRRIGIEGGDKFVGTVSVRTMDGNLVLVTINVGRKTRHLNAEADGRRFSFDLPPQSIATFVWPGNEER